MDLDAMEVIHMTTVLMAPPPLATVALTLAGRDAHWRLGEDTYYLAWDGREWDWATHHYGEERWPDGHLRVVVDRGRIELSPDLLRLAWDEPEAAAALADWLRAGPLGRVC